ncbi:MAG: hemolysin family protein [Chitinophagaceae bacterium]|nr:hemolysin family protein [Chitinophagaceae bacterium]
MIRKLLTGSFKILCHPIFRIRSLFYLRISMGLNTILFFLLTILLMAFFAGIEMAFYSANRMSLELRKRKGGAAIQILFRFIESPARFLGVTLFGFTLFLVLFALQISAVLQPVWKYFGLEIASIRIVIEIIIATLIVLLFAEFIPRAYFRAHSNTLLIRLAYVADFFYQLFSPVASRLIDFSEWTLKYIFNIRISKEKQPLNRSVLKNLFEENDEETDSETNTQLLENAQELPKIKVRHCLVPRKEIVGIEVNASLEDLKKKFIETKLSKLVVYEKNIDNIVGYVHQLDLFKKPDSIRSVLHPIPAVPESMSASDLIGKLSRERKSMAWVVDEFGGTSGIVTMEDVLEELFGEIKDEYDSEKFVENQISDTEYIFSGRLELDYLEEKYGFEFSEKESETLSGYIISHCEKIPSQKERIIIDDYEFDILNVSETRIETVKMKILK